MGDDWPAESLDQPVDSGSNQLPRDQSRPERTGNDQSQVAKDGGDCEGNVDDSLESEEEESSEGEEGDNEESGDEAEVPDPELTLEGATPSSLFDVASTPDVPNSDSSAIEVENVLGDNNETTKATGNTKWKTFTDSDGWTTVNQGYSSEPEKTGILELLSINNARYFPLWAEYLQDKEPEESEEPVVWVAVISTAEEDEGGPR